MLNLISALTVGFSHYDISKLFEDQIKPQSVLISQANRGIPEWAKRRTSPVYVQIGQDSMFLRTVDRNFIPLGNYEYGFVYRLKSRHETSDIVYMDFYGKIDCHNKSYGIYGVFMTMRYKESYWTSRCQQSDCWLSWEPKPQEITEIRKSCPR